MPKRSASSYPRTNAKRSRRVRRPRMRLLRTVRSRPLMRCQRTTYIGNWQPSTVGTNDFWRYYTFSLSQVTNRSDFTNLFDQYRITGLKYVFRPRFSGFDGSNTTDTTLPGVTNQAGVFLHVIVDPQSVFGPTGVYSAANLNLFLEQGDKVKTYSGNRAVKVFFRPLIKNTVEGGNAQLIRAPWLNTTNDTIGHQGFHIFAQDPNMTGVFGQSFDVFVTAYMQFKSMR